MPDYLPKKDVDFVGKAQQIIAALVLTPVAFGTTAEVAGDLQDKLDAFVAARNASDAAQAAAQIAVTAKNDARVSLESDLRPLVRQIQENPAVTNEMRSNAAIPIRDTVRTTAAPVAAANLVVTGGADGVNSLKWSGNGNTPGAMFRIEARSGSTGDFVLVDKVAATSFKHTGQTPGARKEYRIVAERSGQLAAPSNTAVVFAGS